MHFFINFLIYFSFSEKPIFLIPGYTGSDLYATILEPDYYPSCPSLPPHFQIYPFNDTFIKKYPDCNGLLFTSFYNNKTRIVEHLPGIKVESAAFGDVSTIPSYNTLISRLIKEGYVPNKTLFGCPYDWTLYYSGLPFFFDELKRNIEDATKSLGEKAILVGHSMGAHVVRLLLHNYTESSWAEKYVDKIIFNAPAFYGCSDLYKTALEGDIEGKTQSEMFAKAIRQMPSVLALFENYNIIKDKYIFVPENITPSQVKDFLYNRYILDERSLVIFKTIEDSLIEEPFEPPVQTLLFYNSGQQTPVAFNSTNYDIIYGPGDGSCQSDIIDVLCEKWSRKTKCIDWKSSNPNFGHIPMLSEPSEIEMILGFINKDEEL